MRRSSQPFLLQLAVLKAFVLPWLMTPEEYHTSTKRFANRKGREL